jgi:hypothetical protein
MGVEILVSGTKVAWFINILLVIALPSAIGCLFVSWLICVDVVAKLFARWLLDRISS